MKKFKLIIFSFVCFVTFWNITTFAFDYEIEDYNINIIVNENNTFNVTEKIKVNFLKPKHGLYRRIFLTNSFKRSNNTIFSNAVQIENISVNENFSKSKEEGYQIIKIGNKDETLIGTHEYEIKYTYEVWRDASKEIDEIYYPIIGNGWEDTIIKNTSFTITMPKAFDESSLQFLSGHELNIYNANVDYKVDGNTIIGKMNRALIPKESLSADIFLPEGYFSKNKLEEDKYPIYVMIFCVICILITYSMWLKYGKDNKIEKLIEYYPPIQYNSLEVGVLESGTSDKKSVISLLIYLANKGYLKIEQNEVDIWPFKNKKDFKIKKLKKYTGNNKNEKIFFNALFNSRNELFLSDLSDELEDDFFKAICEIENNIYTYTKEKNVFDKTSIRKIIWLIIMALLIFILTNARPVVMLRGIYDAFLIALIPGYAYMIGPTLMSYMSAFYLLMFVVGNACLLVVVLFIFIMPKRTQYGNDILEKINGFKEFIKKAKKEDLEALIKKDPNYFYEILPYAYSLGILENCIEKFKNLEIEQPSWYYSVGEFDFQDFSKFVTLNMTSVVVTMNIRASRHRR